MLYGWGRWVNISLFCISVQVTRVLLFYLPFFVQFILPLIMCWFIHSFASSPFGRFIAYHFSSFLRSLVSPLKLVYLFLSPFFFLSVPLGGPVNISAQNTSSTSIKISWKPVSETLRLGIISKYVFNITNLLTGDLRTIEFDGSSLSGEVRNLSKFQEYSIQGAAVNSKGQSNFTSAITCRTSEDSKSASLFRIYFKEPYPLGD